MIIIVFLAHHFSIILFHLCKIKSNVYYNINFYIVLNIYHHNGWDTLVKMRHLVFSQSTPIVLLSFCFPSAFSSRKVLRKLSRKNKRRKVSSKNGQRSYRNRFFFLLLILVECIVKIDGKVAYDKSSLQKKTANLLKRYKEWGKTCMYECRNLSHNNFLKSKIHTKFQESENCNCLFTFI